MIRPLMLNAKLTHYRRADVWSLRTGKPVEILRGHQAELTDIGFSPQSGMVITASDDGTIRLWQLPEPLKVLIAHTPGSKIVDISQNGDRAIVSSSTGSYSVRNISTGKVISVLKGVGKDVGGLKLGPSGRCVSGTIPLQRKAPVGPVEVEVWDVGGGQLKAKFVELHSNALSADLSPDCSHVVTTSFQGPIQLRPIGQERQRPITLVKSQEYMSPVFSLDGRLVALTGQYVDEPPVFDATSGIQRFTLKGHSRQVNDLAFSRDGRYIVTAGDDSTVRLWSAQNGRLILTWTGFGNSVSGTSFSPDGRYAVAWSEDQTLHVWRVADGRSIAVIHLNSPIQSASLLAGDQLAVTSAQDQAPTIWDLRVGQPILEVGALGSIPTAGRSGTTLVLRQPGGEVDRYECEVCQPIPALLRIAEARVTRRPTPQEAALYGL